MAEKSLDQRVADLEEVLESLGAQTPRHAKWLEERKSPGGDAVVETASGAPSAGSGVATGGPVSQDLTKA